jgi:Antitoxin to bacterial toxin RNase LS or RnlA
MKNYEIRELSNHQDYQVVIFSTSYINPLEEYDHIQEELKGRFKGKVLFDLLMSNGISSNRYVEAEFNGAQFDPSSFKAIEKVDVAIKAMTNKFYKSRSDLSNSVLSNTEISLIRK